MYYILNETNQIVAADDNLLKLCGVSDINELISSVIKNDTRFDFLSDDSLLMTNGSSEETYDIHQVSLSSMLGKLTLVQLLDKEVEEETTEENDTLTPLVEDDLILDTPDVALESEIEDLLNDNDTTEDSDTLSLLDTTDSDTLEIDDSLEMLVDEKAVKKDDTDVGEHLNFDDELLELTPTTEEVEEKVEEKSLDLDDGELFDLVSDNDTVEIEEDTISPELDTQADEIPLSLGLDDEEEEIALEEAQDVSEIFVDIEQISKKIGISPDDYQGFLNEFIDTSLNLEKDLQSSDEQTRTDAISTLAQLSDVLHLSELSDIVENIATSDESNSRTSIESFYSALSRVTTSHPEETETALEKEPEEVLELFDDVQQAEELQVEDSVRIVEAPEEVEKKLPAQGFGTISLDGIKPKHFDFQLEEAANDLSLPVELIEEFVHDFIEQAHIETKKMLEAYELGDFDTIKKIGHLLKGASSNLRINALSDTLYKIQFCEDSNHLEPLIKDYWAHFLSFENQINVISN